MAYPPQPPQPHPQEPWGPQAQGAPQETGQPASGPPPGQTPSPSEYGPPAPQFPYGLQDQQPPYPAQGQQPPYAQQPPYSPQGQHPPYDQQGQYGQQAPAYPPQPPYAQHPLHAQPTQPSHPAQYGAPGTPYAPGQLPTVHYGPPPKRNMGLIVGLSVAVGLVVLAGGGYGAYVYLKAPGPAPTIALRTHTPTIAPTPPATTPPPQPTDDPSSTPSDPPSSEPSTAPTNPKPTQRRAVPGSPITHGEFTDWDFGLDGVKFSADKVAGWTYSSCDPVDGEGVLARYDCQRAVQLAYSAYSGHIKAVQLMMSFPTEKAAKDTAARLAKLTSDAVTWRKDKAHGSYAYGKIRSGAAKKYVVVTIVTADSSGKAKAGKFHGYLQADIASYFLLRDLTITS